MTDADKITPEVLNRIIELEGSRIVGIPKELRELSIEHAPALARKAQALERVRQYAVNVNDEMLLKLLEDA